MDEKTRLTLATLVKVRFQKAKETEDFLDGKLIEELCYLVLEQEKEIRRLKSKL